MHDDEPVLLSLRVPAGEAWRRDAVVWTTLAAEVLGALLVAWALLRLTDTTGTAGTGRGMRSPAAAAQDSRRRRSARLRNEKEE